MTYASDVDLNLARLIQDDIRDFTPEEVLEMELALMDAIAIKVSGGEHLVCWDAAGDYQ